MSTRVSNEFLIGQSIASAVIFIASAAFLPQALAMSGMSGLLPTVMLVALMGLAGVLGVQTVLAYRRAGLDGRVFVDIRRFGGALALSIVYVLVIPVIGFYPATAIMVPVTAALFGYRKPWGLALATVLFVGGLALLFHTLMQRAFPGGLWLN